MTDLDQSLPPSLKIASTHAIASTSIDKVALLWGRANTATVAAEGCATALGLALIILEHEEIVRSKFSLRSL